MLLSFATGEAKTTNAPGNLKRLPQTDRSVGLDMLPAPPSAVNPLRARWAEYSRAKDEMFAVTDIKQAPWHVVNAEDKKCARLNVIRHLLSLIPYEDLTSGTGEAASTG